MYNKLYEISVVSDASSSAHPLSYSHDIEKLTDSVYNKSHTWSVCNDPSSPKLKRHSEEGEFPYYMVREVNFII